MGDKPHVKCHPSHQNPIPRYRQGSSPASHLSACPGNLPGRGRYLSVCESCPPVSSRHGRPGKLVKPGGPSGLASPRGVDNIRMQAQEKAAMARHSPLHKTDETSQGLSVLVSPSLDISNLCVLAVRANKTPVTARPPPGSGRLVVPLSSQRPLPSPDAPAAPLGVERRGFP